MLFAEMAWKNMFRYKKRTLITAFAIAAGVGISIIMTGLIYGIDEESNRNIIRYETGSAVVYPAGYYEEREYYPLKFFIEPAERNIIEEIFSAQKIAFTPRVRAAAEIYFTGTNSQAEGSVSAILTAVDSAGDSAVFDIRNSLISGNWLEENTESAVIGSWLAQDTGTQTGDYITVQCRGRGGFYQSFDVPITGIVETPNPVINSSAIFMDLAWIDDMLALDGAVTEYAVAAEENSADSRQLKTAAQSLANTGSELYTWQTLAADVIALAQSKGKISQLMLLFIFIIAAVGISNTMLMAVMERKNEIAMLRTLGYKPGGIRSLFILEGFFIGCLGSAAGIIIGFPVNWYMTVQGIDMGFLFRGINIGYRVASIMRSGWDIAGFISIAGGAVLISALAAWFPSGRILKKEIADNFRSN